MFTYVAYGLGIHAPLELPELLPRPAPPDVVIGLGPVPDPREPNANDGLCRVSPDEAVLCWRDVGAMRLRHGREITLDARPGVEAGLLRLYLLGPALGLILHQRGMLVLHASAVALASGVVAFLGHSGQGKSTTAAMLSTRGGAVVGDDVVAVDVGAAGGPAALPGVSQLRLWSDAVSALGEAPERLPRVYSGDDKLARTVGTPSPTPRPLLRLYVLADGEALALEPLTGHAAVFELLQHSFVAPVLGELGSSSFLAECARLAATVPVRRLRRPRCLAGLGSLAALVEADVRDGAPAPSPSR